MVELNYDCIRDVLIYLRDHLGYDAEKPNKHM